VLDKGIVIAEDTKIKLVDVELPTRQIRLVICSVDKAREMGMDWWAKTPRSEANPELSPDYLSRIEERPAKIESHLSS
jgi:hypothetical protein